MVCVRQESLPPQRFALMRVNALRARAARLGCTMVLNLKHRSNDLAALSAQEASALLACARGLRESPAAANERALRGKNLCLLAATQDQPGTALLLQAATGLGAHVARVPPSLSAASSPDEVQHTARLLGRLYDGVACAGMPSELVRRIAADADVPVFDGIAAPDHPVVRLAEQLGEDTPAQDNQRLLLQALLLCTLA
jgi:ornithine carbamoyltransferase